MKKLFALALIAILALTTTAFAATYRYDDDDIVFTYDENLFDVTMDDHTDDEDLVILSTKDEKNFIRIHLADLDDGETFPTLADFKDVEEGLGVKVETLETWANGYKNVFTYTVDNGDGTTETTFIAPVYDDDGEIDDILTVRIGVEKDVDEEAGMARDDAISEIVNTLKVDD